MTTWKLTVLGLPFLLVTSLVSPTRAPSAAAASSGDCALAGAQYVGAKSCKKCHFSQHRSWAKTKMAHAFETLKPGVAAEAKTKHGLDPARDYRTDATCLPCHTTGYGKPGGFPTLLSGAPWTDEERQRATLMEGVQCEACHGPGSLSNVYKKDHEAYKKAAVLELGMIEPDAANCESCHNPKSPTVGDDYKLDYKGATKDPAKIHKHKKLKHKH